jgi:DNA-binding NtrC family response regulator
MKPARILVIDDELSLCKACRLVLSGANCIVDIATTGKAGIQALETSAYDGVLLDMRLPDMDGLKILDAIHGSDKNIQVVVMTAYSTVQNAVQSMKSGAYDYLTKPFTDDTLLLAVQRAMEKKRILDENRRFRGDMTRQAPFGHIIGESPKILQLFDKVRRVAPTDATVLLYGESGTGKELFAKAIHSGSERAKSPFIAVDCSTFSPSLLESELFGHVKGAFTGATRDEPGIFEAAKGGTLFLDEVTNLNLDIQSKLLRVVESGEFKPVGSNHARITNIRLIAATNRELKAMVGEGQFREDLYYRLNVFPLTIPPLRERKEDVPRLAYHFLRFYCRKTGKRIEGFSGEAMESLVSHDWPGNVRQLRNVVERLVILADNTTIDLLYLLDHLGPKASFNDNPIPETLEELNAAKKRLLTDVFGQVQRAFVIQALKATKGNITRAAEKVGMQRPNFCALLKTVNVSPELIRAEPADKKPR